MSKPDWSTAPNWAKWVAQDADGQWIWFDDEKPVASAPHGRWQTGWLNMYKETGIYTAKRGDWIRTLEGRPEYPVEAL